MSYCIEVPLDELLRRADLEAALDVLLNNYRPEALIDLMLLRATVDQRNTLLAYMRKKADLHYRYGAPVAITSKHKP